MADALFTAVYDGGTSVTNNDGTLELGLGAVFDFSRTNRGQAPRGLLTIPVQIGNIAINAGADLEDESTDDNAEDNQVASSAGGNGDGEDSAQENTNDTQTVAGNEGQGNSTANNVVANTDNNSDSSAILARLSEAAATNPTLSNNLVSNQTVASRYPLYRTRTTGIAGDTDPDEPTAIDTGNAVIINIIAESSGENINPVRAVAGLNSANTNNAGGNSSNGSDDAPGNSGNSNAGGNSGNGNNNDVVSETGANGSLNLGAGWGAWSVPGVASVQASGLVVTAVSVNVPADMVAMRSTSGRWTFNSNGQFSGSGTAGNLTALGIGFDVNLNSGNVSNGSFNATVGNGAESWSMSFSGSVSGASATMSNFSSGISGSMSGAFTGSNGVAGFALTNAAGSALGGLGVLQGTPQ